MQINGRYLLAAGKRPASLYWRGGEVRIDIHDVYYCTMRRKMLMDLRALHPDGIGERRRVASQHSIPNAAIYRQAMKHYKVWLKEEKFWYEVFGLIPPTLKSVPLGKVQAKEFLYSPRTDRGHGTSYKAPFTTRRSRSTAGILGNFNKRSKAAGGT